MNENRFYIQELKAVKLDLASIISNIKIFIITVNSIPLKQAKNELLIFIINYNTKIDRLTLVLDNSMLEYQKIVDSKIIYFEPWKRILDLIQLTKDAEPIPLHKISHIINTDYTHAEELLIMLLKDDKNIGKYSPQEKIYTKGIDIKDIVSNYIAQVRDLNLLD